MGRERESGDEGHRVDSIRGQLLQNCTLHQVVPPFLYIQQNCFWMENLDQRNLVWTFCDIVWVTRSHTSLNVLHLLENTSPIHSAQSLRELCADSPHRHLYENYRCGQGGLFRCVSECEWKSQRRGSGVCLSDGVHSLITKQILHSSNEWKMTHTSTYKAMLHNQTTVMW